MVVFKYFSIEISCWQAKNLLIFEVFSIDFLMVFLLIFHRNPIEFSCPFLLNFKVNSY